jgi:hypothetical protein
MSVTVRKRGGRIGKSGIASGRVIHSTGSVVLHRKEVARPVVCEPTCLGRTAIWIGACHNGGGKRMDGPGRVRVCPAAEIRRAGIRGTRNTLTIERAGKTHSKYAFRTKAVAPTERRQRRKNKYKRRRHGKGTVTYRIDRAIIFQTKTKTQSPTASLNLHRLPGAKA